MGEVGASPTTEFITNDWPSGDTTYCCLFVLIAVLPTLVTNKPSGMLDSTVLGFEAKRIGTAISRSSGAM